MLGIELSEKQGNINWKKVKKIKNIFVMLCCGYGKRTSMEEIRTDKSFDIHVKACENFEIPFGIYFDSYARSRREAEWETEYVSRLLQGLHPTWPVMLRFGDCQWISHMDELLLGDIAQGYCEMVEQKGYQPGICADKYCFTNLLTDVRFDQWNRWIIQHHKECTYAGTYTMWEYTSDGRIEGIAGSVTLLEGHVPYGNSESERMRDRQQIEREKMSRTRADEAGAGKTDVDKAGMEEAESKESETKGAEIPDLSGYIGTSLVGALNKKRYPSDMDFRRSVAVQTGLVREPVEYRGTASQNIELLRKLGGTISASKMIREGSYIKLKPGSWNINTDSPFEAVVYQNIYQVLAISGVSVIFGIQGTVIGKVNRNSVVVI